MSHINKDGSRFLSDRDDSTHRCPQVPSDITTERKSSPASVSLYSTTPGVSVGTEMMTPTSSSSFSRFDSSEGDMDGTPRRKSLKRVVPHSNSRTTSAVQREQMTSAAMATGQNCA